MTALRRYREQLNLTQQDIADRLDLGRQYVSEIERGERKLVHSDTREKVAHVGYRLPVAVFDALRKGRIGVAKALKESLDADHGATECGATTGP